MGRVEESLVVPGNLQEVEKPPKISMLVHSELFLFGTFLLLFIVCLLSVKGEVRVIVLTFSFARFL